MDEKIEEKKIVSIEDRIPKLKEARKKKANRRLVFYLSVFFSLIAIVIYLQSPLSHVQTVQVKGNELIDENEIIELTEITNKTNIWMIHKKQVLHSLLEHSLIKDATIERQLPQSVQINIEEHPVIGYIYEDNTFHPVLENGMIVTTAEITHKGDGPVLNNFTDEQFLQRMAEELRDVPVEIFQLISEVNWEPTKKNQYKITLFMNDGYIVKTTIRNFANKIKPYPSIVSQLDENEKGIIHMDVGTYFEKID